MEEALLAAFRAGDPDAVRSLYQQYSRPVATVARSIVGNDQSLIDEIVQQTFTKAWRAAQSFKEHAKFSPWLYAIARRSAIDAVRAERRPTRGDHEPEVDVAVDPPSMEQTWEAYEVRRAIASLPPDEQDVVKMGHLLGMPHAEIAKQLNVPIGTVKSRSYRAHRRLAAALAHLEERPDSPEIDLTDRKLPEIANQSSSPSVRLSREV